MHGMKICLHNSRPSKSDTVIGIMVFRNTHDRKILRILIVAYMTEFLSVMTIQLVKRMLVAKVNSSGKPFCNVFIQNAQ
jgi:hypothetical protein